MAHLTPHFVCRVTTLIDIGISDIVFLINEFANAAK